MCLPPLNLIETELLLTLLGSRAPSEPSSSLILKTADASAAGSTDTFLSSRLRFIVDSHGQNICLLKTGEDEVGVMMGWEQGISEPLTAYFRESGVDVDSIKCRTRSTNSVLTTRT